MKEQKQNGIKQEESLLSPNAIPKVYDMPAEFEDAASVSGPEFCTKKAL